MKASPVKTTLGILALSLCGSTTLIVSALTTVLDPHGLTLLASAPTQSTASRGDPNGGDGLRGVDMLLLGSFMVEYSSTTIEACQSSRSAVDAAVLGLLETAIEKLRDSKKETQGVFQNPSAPIVVIDGHWCPLSLDEKAQRGNGRYTLRIPYAGASNSGVDVYLLPQWLSDVVGGGPGGGTLLVYTNSSSQEATKGASVGGGRAPIPVHSSAASFQPFVQIASWGRGYFNPLMRLTSTSLTLEGEQQKSTETETTTIRTRSGDLEIAPAADLHITVGPEPNGEVRVDATGPNGTISLLSQKLCWATSSSRSSSRPLGVEHCDPTSSSRRDAPHQARSGFDDEFSHDAILSVSAEGLDAQGIAVVNLSAALSFGLAVVRSPDLLGEPSNGGVVTGDERSVNISGGAVGLEALVDAVEITGTTGASLISCNGPVLLDSNGGNSSLLLDTDSILATAETVTLRGYHAMGSTTSARKPSIEAHPPRSDAVGESQRRGAAGPGGNPSGSFLNLTGELATIGGPWGASLDADHEVRLRANDSSLVRVSSEGIFLENTTVLVLRSSSQPRLITLPPTRIPPLSQPARSPGLGGDSVVTMDGGNIVMNASQSFDFDIPGALIKLSRRCGDSTRGSDCVAKAGRESGTSRSSVCVKDDEASLLADADTVEILGRSGAGVTIAAGGPFGGDERLENMGQSDAWQSHNKTLAGGRVKVVPHGVFVEGVSASMTTSDRIVLQLKERSREIKLPEVTGMSKNEASNPKWTTLPEDEERSRVELNGSGVEVVAASSKSVLIRAGSRIVLDTPDLTISHKSSVVGLGSKNGRDERNRDGRDTDGGVGIWSNGSSLTGRAHHLVLFQAGRSSDGSRTAGPATPASNSRLSIEEDLVRINAGGEFGPTGRVPTSIANGEPGASPLRQRGLSITSIGSTNLSSTEGMNLGAEELQLSSSNQTTLHSPGGVLIAGFAPHDGDVAGGAGAIRLRRGMSRLPGHILIAPAAGSGVGIGPAFSSRDLQGSTTGAVPSLLYVTNSTRQIAQRLVPSPDAHLAVESSGDSAVAVLSPRGSRSAIRFGSTELPYSGGLSLLHHRDGANGDKILLELASSPGRIVGDSLGRWAVGAVTEQGPTATLHIVALPKTNTNPGNTAQAESVALPSASLLVESQAPGAAVIQLLRSSVPHIPEDNAVVFTSRYSGKRQPDLYRHWVLSQMGRESAPALPWTDSTARSPSWRGGLILAHVIGGSENGWRSGLGAVASATDNANEISSVQITAIFGEDGRSGFGTGSTGARVTVGGAILVEQVLLLSDEGLVRDVTRFGAQGREEAMDCLRQLEVVNFGWSKEAWRAYDLEPDIHQIGLVAQQVEKQAPSLVWKDPLTGRKAVSHSRLLFTLLAAFQHVDSACRFSGETRDDRLQQLETRAEATAERSSMVSERLRTLEAAAETGMEASHGHDRKVAALEGRFSEQGKRMDAVATALSAAQDIMTTERGENQLWRGEQSTRETELRREVRELTRRLEILEEKRRVELEEQGKRLQAHDEQIRAFNLRLGAYQASQASCESSLQSEVEKLQQSQRSLDALVSLFQQTDMSVTPQTEEDYFLAEVRKIEDRIRLQLRDRNGNPQAEDGMARERVVAGDVRAVGAGMTGSVDEDNLATQMLLERQHLERHSGPVRAEAFETVRRHREHINALRAMNGG